MDETTPIVEKDVIELRKELDRQGQEGKPHIPKKWMYLLGVIILLFAMFVFGLLTKPGTQQGEITVVQAVLDENAPLVVQPEFGQRIQALYAAASVGTALIPTEKSEAVTPKILTWTPPNKEQVNEDLPPISGRYEIPSGWFGRVRLLSDGKEIGSVSVDARQTKGDKGYQGTFSFTPKRSSLGNQVSLGFDAVESCRLVCAPADVLCQKKHKDDYCLGQHDNQTFLSYTTVSMGGAQSVGSCVEKTFVAGPKNIPKVPEDYNMCARGQWNAPIARDVLFWLTNNSSNSEDASRVLPLIYSALRDPNSLPSSGTKGKADKISWEIKYQTGDPQSGTMCSLNIIVRIDCE